MQRPDAITRAQMPPSSRRNPNTPIILGIVVVLLIIAIILLFTLVIPLTAEKSAEKRSERVDAHIHEKINQTMTNLNKNGTILQTEPSLPINQGLLAIEKPFETEKEKEERN